MRPAKFFLALLFGAAVLITFLKLLFFGIMAATVFGIFYSVFRAGQFVAGRNHYPQQQAFQFGEYPPALPFGQQQQHAQPIQPGFFRKETVGRHIEVL